MSLDFCTPCVVIDVTDMDEMTNFHGGGKQLGKKAPTVLQLSRDIAEREALRLSARNPGRQFIVLEAVAVARAVRTPTHMTLGGRVVAEAMRPMLVKLASDDTAPF